MSELYTVTAEEGRLRFLPRTDAALEQAVLDEEMPDPAQDAPQENE